MWDCIAGIAATGALGLRNPDQLPQTTAFRRGTGPQQPDPCNKVGAACTRRSVARC